MAKNVCNRDRLTHGPNIWVMEHKHKIIIIDMFMEIRKNLETSLVCGKKKLCGKYNNKNKKIDRFIITIDWTCWKEQ